MRILRAALAATLITAPHASAEVKVTLKAGRMDILATKASVQDILDRVASQTGMKVIYDGVLPPKVITKSVTDRTPADAVLGMPEGEGLNFAVILNPAGTQVETLLVTGPSKARPSAGPPMGMPAPVEATEWAVEGAEPPPPPP